MKNYKVKAKIVFDDVVEKVHRNIGDEFLCDEERYKFLSNHYAVDFVEKVEDIKPIEEVKEIVEEVIIKPKKTTTRKDTTAKPTTDNTNNTL